MIEAQGGDTRAFDDVSALPHAHLQRTVRAASDGYVARLDALTIAHAATALGAGRARKGDRIDLSVGLVLQVKVGDPVGRGQPLGVLHANDEARLADAEELLRRAAEISAERVAPPPLILERLATAQSVAAPG
jgi:pyrimidine-nucleoside phosphorylase